MKLLNDEVQKKELLAFEENMSNNGAFSYSASSGLHDDCVMALVMVWHVCVRMSGGEALIVPAEDPIVEIEKDGRGIGWKMGA